MEGRSCEDHRISFGKFENSLVLLIFICPIVMKEEVKLRILNQGIHTLSTVVDSSLPPESPRNVSLLFSLPGLQTDLRSGPSPSCERQDSTFDDNWAFLPIFLGRL